MLDMAELDSSQVTDFAFYLAESWYAHLYNQEDEGNFPQEEMGGYEAGEDSAASDSENFPDGAEDGDSAKGYD